MDFLLGGFSGVCAGFFANTFDVSGNKVKIIKSYVKLS